MRALLFAAAASLALATTAAAEPSAQALALAQRYMAATGGSYELVEEQSYIAAGILGGTPDSHERQLALQQAADRHRPELAALDAKLAALMADTFTEDELRVSVDFLESPAGRSIAEKKHAYFTAMFVHDRPPLTYSAEENAAIAAYQATPQAIAMQAKSPDAQKATLTLAEPVQTAIRKSAQTIYCHATRKCSGGDSGYDPLAGPSIRE